MSPESISVSIVLLGRFDPSLFRLEQLVNSGALSEADSSESSYRTLVSEQVVEIVLPWGDLSVIPERVSISASKLPFVRTADLALKCLREIAPRSLVTQFGINLVARYRFASIEARDEFGTRLVPPGSWGSWGRDVVDSLKRKGQNHGGMTLAILRQGLPDDREAGWLDARVEPSPDIQAKSDVQISMNDHYGFAAANEGANPMKGPLISALLLDRLEQTFDQSVERSTKIVEGIISGR